MEGSIAITGAAVQWLRDNLGLIQDAAETEAIAASIADAGLWGGLDELRANWGVEREFTESANQRISKSASQRIGQSGRFWAR
jgi:glycerol kinase